MGDAVVGGGTSGIEYVLYCTSTVLLWTVISTYWREVAL